MAEGNPYDALYNDTIAGIELAENTGLSEVGETLKGQERGVAEGEEAQKRAEPVAYKRIDNLSNRQGLLESGFEAGRTGRQESQFAAQRLGRQRANEEAKAGGKRREETIRNEGANKRKRAGAEAETRQYNYNLEHPKTGTQYPIPPGQQLAIAEGVPAGPGGVVPYQEGGVRVGMPRARRTAAQKVVRIG